MDLSTPFFPIGYEIFPGVFTGRTLETHAKYQIVQATGTARHLLITHAKEASDWISAQLLPEQSFVSIEFGGAQKWVLRSEDQTICSLAMLPQPKDVNEALALSKAVKNTSARLPTANLADAIYIEKYLAVLPIDSLEERLSCELVLGRYLTGGAHVPCTNLRRIRTYAPWLSSEELQVIAKEILAKDLQDRHPPEPTCAAATDFPMKTKGHFSLPGRTRLEAFLREQVIDIIENFENYSRLGLGFPGGVLLHGSPGTGKTYAVERLLEYLDWPSFSIDSSTIGSPYIHETGKRIAAIFNDAVTHAPSIIVIDEMEAFLPDRHGGSDHRIEEVAEFLRRIPAAIDKHVLIIGMTNRLDLIDRAILRRGRFDHIVEVSMPTSAEVYELLSDLFSQRPCEQHLPLEHAAQVLAQRPLSDVAFVVRESARLAAKAGKRQIDTPSVLEALTTIAAEKDK